MTTRTGPHPGRMLGALSAAVLVACGGGGGGGSGIANPPPATTVTVSGKAVDGPLQGATACYDLNDNGACDSGEPTSAPTGANGAFSFDVASGDAGRHRVVVVVPASAIDADTGAAVGTAFTLQSPATGSTGAQSVFVSPLTTLVQSQVDLGGSTLTDAIAVVQSQAGLTISPLADFTATNNADNQQAARVARLLQLTTLAQSAELATVVGQVDLSGATISAADVAKAVHEALIVALPVLAGKAAEPAVAGASGAELQAALAAAAQAVAEQSAVTAEQAKAAIGVAKLPPDNSAETPVATASLTALRYTDANNWYYRTLEAGAADNLPDANNRVRYYDVHRVSESSGFSPNGTIYSWALGNLRSRAGDLHWNGTAWVGCSFGDRYLADKRDASGNSNYDFCDGYERGASSRSAVDLAGQSIAAVVATKIRTFPGGASGVAYADWGPADPAAAFGNATFPAGARLYYQTNTIQQTAFAYDVQAAGAVTAFSAAIAAGGDARATPSLACNANPTPAATAVTTLEDLVARNPGRPCIVNKAVAGADSSLDPNEWWSNSTASLGILAGAATLPAGTGNWYSTDLRLRVAFAPTGNTTTYYSCLSRAATGSSRNCTAIGTGTYAIQTLGDARVMTFTGLPALAQRTGFARVFVERGGKVWFGFQNPSNVSNRFVRLNLEATNAIFAALPGLPPVRPVSRVGELDQASRTGMQTLVGAWGSASDTEAILFRFGNGGRFVMGQAAPENTATREQTGGELGWFEYEGSTGRFRALVEVDSNLTAGTSHPGPAELNDTLTITPTQFSTSAGEVFARLPDGSSGLVGLWALGSATELKTQHFAFFPNGKVLLVDPLGDTSGGACTAARQGPPGAEFASYTFDAAAGTLRVFGKVYDTNGCAGVFDSSQGAVAAGTANTEANFTVVFSNDGTQAFVADTGGSVTLHRIRSQ